MNDFMMILLGVFIGFASKVIIDNYSGGAMNFGYSD